MSNLSYNRIKELLAKNNKKSKDLAKEMGVTTRAVSTWCTNRSQPPIETLFQVARFLGEPARELLTLEKDLRPVGKKKASDDSKEVVKKASPRKATPKKASTRGKRPKGS